MRLWSISPSYLDAKGLIALWREGLLAQKVFGTDKGYSRHSQLNRFSSREEISAYLWAVWEAGKMRGYKFDSSKILPITGKVKPIPVNYCQVLIERSHLLRKLEKRKDVGKYSKLACQPLPMLHPLFIGTEEETVNIERRD